MRILHIEDNVYKHHDIAKVINGCGRISVDWVTYLNEGIKKLEESFENYTIRFNNNGYVLSNRG